jgi:hypothetical protein
MFDYTDYADHTNGSLYSRTRNQGRWGQVWSTLTGRSRRLIALADIDVACLVRARRYAGMQTVPIDQIRGSQGRSDDFDRDFNPLRNHNKERWLSVAAARQRGRTLPPVDLVQVGDVYFVLDGHHRISVARAFGQRDIEAEVTVWQVTGPLPRRESAVAPNPTGQEAGARRLYNKVRDNSARLRERFLMNLRALMAAVEMRLGAQLVPIGGNPNPKAVSQV